MSIDTVIVVVVMGGLGLLVTGARAGAARDRRERLAREHRPEIMPEDHRADGHRLEVVHDDDAPEDLKDKLG